MEEQGKQGNTVRNVVILAGCAFAALFVAMVVVMAVRGAPRPARTYTMTTERALNPLPVRYTSDQPVIFFSAPGIVMRETPILHQSEGIVSPISLYVPAANVVLDDIDLKEIRK